MPPKNCLLAGRANAVQHLGGSFFADCLSTVGLRQYIEFGIATEETASVIQWKIGLTLAAIGLVMGSAQARQHRTVISEAPGVCAIVSDYSPSIYPAPNWDPFFRRHLYRYGPVPTCLPVAGSVPPAPQSIISVRY